MISLRGGDDMKSETGTLTRRGFTQMLGAGAALAALRPPFALGARRAPNTRVARAFAPAANHARTGGAEVVPVRLTSDYRHDLSKMLATTGAGLVYVCNPNNPTASVTPKDEVRAYLAKVPRETFVLVDEAYYHYVEGVDYESVMPLVRDYPNLIVARTFSKIYGMAGLRCGYCVARAQTIERMRAQQTWDSVNIMALVAALASLRDAAQVEQGRRRDGEVKRVVESELGQDGLGLIT